MVFQWEGDNGWVDYDEDVSKKIQKAVDKGQKKLKLNKDYSVNLSDMIQYRNDDPDRQRNIRDNKKRAIEDDKKKDTKKKKGNSGEAVPTGPGVKRLQRDLRLIKKSAADTGAYEVELVDENLYKWDVKIFEFAEDTKLFRDMQQYKAKHGIDYLTMRFEFPNDFPIQPPFVRIITPKIQGGSIHGGALCVDVLMAGRDGGWSPVITTEGLILQCRQLFAEGNASIANINKVEEWAEKEARDSFLRVSQIHSSWST